MKCIWCRKKFKVKKNKKQYGDKRWVELYCRKMCYKKHLFSISLNYGQM